MNFSLKNIFSSRLATMDIISAKPHLSQATKEKTAGRFPKTENVKSKCEKN